MKDYLVYVAVLMLPCLVLCGRPGNKGGENKTDTAGKLLSIDSSISESAKLSPLDFFLKKYADSLNALNNANNFPVFLSNSQFDYENAGIWSPSHHPLPLRFMIMNKVKNCKALKLIASSDNANYKSKPVKQNGIDIQYLEFSFHELALSRYRELKCTP